jgi:hypothetical protein
MKKITRMNHLTVLAGIFMLPTASLPVRSSFAAEVFGPLAAAHSGLEVANDMIAQGELDPGWAAALSSVAVTIRNIKGFTEYVVTLTRSSGIPAEISIYLNMSGGYSGSSLGSSD